MEPQTQYIFKRPLWRRALPLLVLSAMWGSVLVLLYAVAGHPSDKFSHIVATGYKWAVTKGITLPKGVIVAAILSLPLIYIAYWGFEQLLITSQAIIRLLPFGFRRSLRWDEMDEVMIDHVEVRFEGGLTALKVMTFYATPSRFLPFRRRLRLTNREFECYHHVERIASDVSIPAIAARKRREIEVENRPACFAERNTGDGVRCLIFVVIAVAALAIYALNSLWPGSLLFLRPFFPLVAGLAVVLAARMYFYRQIGVDQSNIYIMRRNWTRKKIPLDTLADVRVLDNRMRILVRNGKGRKVRQVFKTRRFIRNRGVLLRLIREMAESRRVLNAVPVSKPARTPVVTPANLPASA